jgi:AraC-like DNA-binding protein
VNNIVEYIWLAEYTAPAFTSLGCAILLLLSFDNSYSYIETRIKRVAFFYMCWTFVSCATIALYVFFPEAFVPVQAMLMLSLLSVQVLFYRLFHILTAADGRRRFSPWHYIVPLGVAGTFAGGSLLVPYEIQLDITKGLGAVIPRGYEAYAWFFISKVPLRLVWCIVYVTLTVVLLVRYYRRINSTSNLVRRPARWMVLLMGFTLTSVIIITVVALIRSNGLYLSYTVGLVAITMMAQHIVLTYTVLQRNYVLYIVPAGATPRTPSPVDAPQKKIRITYSRDGDNSLVRKQFEAWMRERKPWLDPHYKMTDLAEELDVNRTYVSHFINSTYGVNFSRYMNRLRLAELGRLAALPSNRGKPAKALIARAGFYGERHYQNARAAERAERAERADKNETP